MSRASGGAGRAWSRWAVWALIVAPPLWILFCVVRWGVDVPYWDQWSLVSLLELRKEGRLGLADLAEPHNEHRLFFPRLIMVALAAASDWNIRWELFTNVALALLLGFVLYAMGRDTLPRRRLSLFLVPASLLIFSPGQSQNWIWGWQIQIFLSVLAVVAAVWLLASSRWPRVAAAVAVGWVGTLSFANVLLLWPLGLVLLGLQPGRRRTALGLWAAGAVLGLGLFFSGYRPGPGSGADLDVGLQELAAYTLAYLGAPLVGATGYGWLSVLVGLLTSVALVFLLGPLLRPAARGSGRRLAPALPWLVLALFAAGSAAMTSLGRAERGIDQALTARYVTIANLWWVGLLGAGLVWLENRPSGPLLGRRGRVVAGAAAALILFALAHTYVSRTQAMAGESRFRGALRELLVTGRTEETLHRFLYPLPRPLEGWLAWLCQERLGVFRDGPAPAGCDFRFLDIDPDARAHLGHFRGRHVVPIHRHGRWLGLQTPQGTIPLLDDAFVGDLRLEDGAASGWAVLEPERRSYDELVICLGQRCVYRGGSMRRIRDDVVRHLSDSSVRLAGFRVLLDEPMQERLSELRVFAVRDGVGGEILTPEGTVSRGSPLSYRLVTGEVGPLLESAEQSAPVVAGAAEGEARLRRRGGRLVVSGWAVANGGPVAEVVVTVNGVATHRPHRLEQRREVAEALGRPELRSAGFRVRVASPAQADGSVRVFAINSGGEAAELPIVSRR